MNQGLAALCNSSIANGRSLKKWKLHQLASMEREIIRAAYNGTFDFFLKEKDSGFTLILRTGNRYFEETDSATAAKYIDAFTKLCERGLVRPTDPSGKWFVLSGRGYELARLEDGRL